GWDKRRKTTAWRPSQVGNSEDDLAAPRGARRQRRHADLPVGMAHRLGTEIGPVGRHIDDEVTEQLAGREIEPQPPTRPNDGGAAVPGVEAIVEHDLVDRARPAE